MLNSLRKDLYSAQYRIFDHKVFLAGEIQSFLQNFETQRNDKEVETLFKATETLGEVRYELSDQNLAQGSKQLAEFSTDVQALLAGVDDFLAKAKQDKPVSAFLQQARLERQRKRAEFDLDWQHKQQRIDNSFEEKEEEIAELYSDLQLKLNIHK